MGLSGSQSCGARAIPGSLSPTFCPVSLSLTHAHLVSIQDPLFFRAGGSGDYG